MEKPVLGRFKSNLKVSPPFALCLHRIACICMPSSPPLGPEQASSTHRPILASKRICAVQMGIVGLPNVGKSTLFNTLGKVSIPAENFPFCTIEPNNVSSYCHCGPCLDALAHWTCGPQHFQITHRFLHTEPQPSKLVKLSTGGAFRQECMSQMSVSSGCAQRTAQRVKFQHFWT